MKDKNTKEIKKFFKKKKLFFAAWSCESKFYTGMAGWYIPLKNFFDKIIIFDPQKYLFLEGRDRMNRHFLEILKREQPDYVLIHGDAEGLSIDTLFKIKEISPNSKIIDFHGDDDTNFEDHSKYISMIVDYNLVFQKEYIKEYKKQRIDNVFFFSAAKIDSFKQLQIEKKYDVTFIGTPRPDRLDSIRFLKKNNIDVKVFGIGWEKYPDLKEIYLGQPSNEEMTKLYNESKINLYFSKNIYGNKLHLKGRIFEIGACKSFALCEYYEVLKTIFKEGKEIVMFRRNEDLLKKIKYYLKNENEREKIANAMYNKIKKKYNLYQELYQLLELIYKQRSLSSKKLPSVNKKIITLSEEDFKKEDSFIKKKIKDYDYISFKEGNSLFFESKDYLQSYSLMMSRKPISCCDYYVYSKRIGVYLRSYLSNLIKERQELYSLLNISQLMVTKEYFLENLQKFYNIFEGKKINFVNFDNTAFISIPLIIVNNLEMDNLKMDNFLKEKVFYNETDYLFSSILYNKHILTDKYLYNFIIEALFFGKFFLLRDIIKRRFSSNKLKTFKRLNQLKNNSLYLSHNKTYKSTPN